MRVLFRPLTVWPHKPTPDYSRTTWPSSKSLTVTKALTHLEQQLRLLGCDQNAYIEVDIDEKHIRQDGELRSTAAPNAPGVVVYATHRKLGDLRWACDHYKKMPDNIRGISMTIQALRAVERYGCVRDSEQFRGFKALPSQSSETLPLTSAINILAKYAPRLDAQTSGKDAFMSAVRAAKSKSHPDLHDGDRNMWDEVERAIAVLAPVRWQ